MIILPSSACPRDITMSIIDFGGQLTPVTGGATQRLNRLGNRFQANVTLPPVESTEVGQALVAKLVRGKSEGIRMEMYYGKFDPGNPGAPVLSSNGQTGTSISVSGLTDGYTIREGQYLSIEQNGQLYLYIAAADVTTSGGSANVPIYPPLRKATQSGAIVHMNPPMIEGFIVGEDWQWSMSVDKFLDISFTIQEAA